MRAFEVELNAFCIMICIHACGSEAVHHRLLGIDIIGGVALLEVCHWSGEL